MSDRIIPPDYFVSPVQAVWAIDQTGEAIEWKDHQCTAIMLQHVQRLCVKLASQLKGLPPLTTIVYIVDALSRGWTKELASDRLSRLSRLPGSPSPSGLAQAQMAAWLSSLQKLDREFRHGVTAHEAFLCEVFEKIPRLWLTCEPETGDALTWLENLVGEHGSLAPTRLPDESNASAGTLTLAVFEFLSMVAIDSESLRLRMRTGLDRLPEVSAIDIVERFPLAELVKQLSSNNDELGSVARMAQSVSATLSLPRLPSDPDVLPIGGVSDVTNRGQPDRLLMSELALDCDLLIARIANGQALYLRREQPPQPEPKHRCLIVETGVRTWGQMRLYAAAFVLGSCIAQERKGGEKIDVVTVGGENSWREDFTSRDGIERFYQRLVADAHPAQAIMNLATDQSSDLNLDSQPILVLSEATDRDAGFRRATQDFPKPHLIARVERAGWVELLQRGSLGDTTLQRMELTQTARPPELKSEEPEGLPLFFEQSPCRLRFATYPNGICVQTYDDGFQDGCWVLTRDRRALLLEDRKLGGIEAGSVPGGQVLASYTPNRNVWQLIVETTPHRTNAPVHSLVNIHLAHGVTVTELKRGDEKLSELTYCFEDGYLIRVGKNITFIDTRTGAELASMVLHVTHLGGNIFGNDDEVFTAEREGGHVTWMRLGKIPSRPGCAGRLEHGIPVVYGHDLSWMVKFDGTAPRPNATKFKVRSAHPHIVERINSDATAILVSLRDVASQSHTANNLKSLFKISLREPKVDFFGTYRLGRVHSFELSKIKFSYQTYSIRNHIQALSFDDDGILLYTNRHRVSIRVHEEPDVLGLKCQLTRNPQGNLPVYYCEKPITKIGSVHDRWKLRPIKLPYGQAWVDSRGLLHLRAKDGSELSLTLNDGLMAGWHSKGGVFGPQYFTATNFGYTNATPEVIQWFTNFARQQAN